VNNDRKKARNLLHPSGVRQILIIVFYRYLPSTMAFHKNDYFFRKKSFSLCFFISIKNIFKYLIIKLFKYQKEGKPEIIKSSIERNFRLF